MNSCWHVNCSYKAMKLYRQHGTTKQYYDIRLYPTLFDDFMLLHQCSRRACMRKGKREYFKTKKEALFHSLQIIEHKQSEGYMISR